MQAVLERSRRGCDADTLAGMMTCSMTCSRAGRSALTGIESVGAMMGRKKQPSETAGLLAVRRRVYPTTALLGRILVFDHHGSVAQKHLGVDTELLGKLADLTDHRGVVDRNVDVARLPDRVAALIE
jgi:hypothetical protein